MADDWDPFADPAGVEETPASEVRKPAVANARATTNGHSKPLVEDAPPPPEPWELTQEEAPPPVAAKSAPSRPPSVRPEVEEADAGRAGAEPEFLPSREFAGNKLGYVYTQGDHGPGYYLERSLAITASAPPRPGPAAPAFAPQARRAAEQLPPPPKDTSLAVVAPTSLPDPEEKEVLMDEQQKEEMREEVKKLKLAKNLAVENEEFEEAAALKRRIKVLEDTLGEAVKYEQAKASRADALAAREKVDPKAKGAPQKPQSQMEHGEALWQMPSDTMKLLPEEREFLQASRMATMRKGVTDDTVNGVPQWAYKDALKDGVKGVKTERPSELQYIFKGQIEDEKWEEGANFQTSVVVQCDVESAFGFCCAPNMGRTDDEEEPNKLQVGPGAHIHHHTSGTAQLSEMMGSEIVENETVVFKVVVVKPKVKGKVKLEAARTVTTREPFQKQPFYSFKSVWRFAAYPAGGTRVVRIVRDFKQFELLEFDALKAVSRSIELENEGLRQSWSSTLAAVPERGALARRGANGQLYERPEPGGTLARRTAVDGEMYNASFVVDASAERVFSTVVSNEILLEYKKFVNEDSYMQLDESHALIRQLNGIVLLVTSRVKAEQRQWMTMTVAHVAGNSFDDAKHITTQQQVMKEPFYRVVEDWLFLEQKEGETTLVRRTMRDFTQTGGFHVTDLPTVITESADAENKALIETFRKIRLKEGLGMPSRPADQAISTRANYAMRQMPEILDQAAKNNVLEVREMLEVKGADPNYIHVRRDSWAVSDSRLEFYEEITPLIVAAEHGACEVIKVLFNHPQIDVNLCCCAFNDVEIYNFYTAYDMTISKKHPHAAALLRARGVLPASSEHVYKPSFDRIHGRPIRETVNQVYEEDDYGYGEMPSWEVVSQGNPRLAEALHQVADTLSMTRSQSSGNKGKIFKNLITDWHPDRHASTGEADIATKVFQWLQVVKPWYMEENGGPATDQQPLPGYDDPDRPVAPAGAQQYLHPSGSVFSVW